MTKIAVYGANGYTGRLVVAEFGRRGVETVLVGRSLEKLRVSATQAGVPGAELRVAGLSDPVQLAGAFRDCAVVVNCVAPFATYGTPVVRAAIAARSHYLDLAGEQRYIQEVFDRFGAEAERAGVTVVPMVNDGGFLGDLIASLVAARLSDVDSLTIAHRFTGRSALSRGSARTALANRELLQSGGRESQVTMTFPDGETATMTSFALPELATLHRHIRARRIDAVTGPDLKALFASVTPELVEQLPADGPSEEDRKAAGFQLVADAVDDAGLSVRGVVEGTDTYGTTAFNAVEAALRLTTRAAKAGVLPPAQAFDPAEFLDSLAVQGVRWSVTP